MCRSEEGKVSHLLGSHRMTLPSGVLHSYKEVRSRET